MSSESDASSVTVVLIEYSGTTFTIDDLLIFAIGASLIGNTLIETVAVAKPPAPSSNS